jgi:hypothetical protein
LNTSSSYIAAVVDEISGVKIHEPCSLASYRNYEANQVATPRSPPGVPRGALGIYGPSGLTVGEAFMVARGRDLNDPAVQAELEAERAHHSTGWVGIYGPSGYTVEEALAKRKRPEGNSKL